MSVLRSFGRLACFDPLGLSCLASCSRTTWESSAAGYASTAIASTPTAVALNNLRDNHGATKKRIRVGRGDGGRRGNYCGRGLNGHNSRSGGGPHLLYDGGQLGLLKFPVVRERPPYEVLFEQLGLAKLLEYFEVGLLDRNKVITMKDLQDSGCLTRIKYGVILTGKVPVHFPIHIQVSACDPDTKQKVEAAGGSVERVYYQYPEGLKALLRPESFARQRLPLPLPAHSWHPKYNGKFDSVGTFVAHRPLPLAAPGT